MFNRFIVLAIAVTWVLGGVAGVHAQGRKKVKQTAVITLEKGGEIRIEFYPEDAPKTVENFRSEERRVGKECRL